jgi:hypothetical protein
MIYALTVCECNSFLLLFVLCLLNLPCVVPSMLSLSYVLKVEKSFKKDKIDVECLFWTESVCVFDVI